MKTNGTAVAEVAAPEGERRQATISAPNLRVARFTLVGVAPYVQLRFSEKARASIRKTMEEGQRSKKGKKREPRDYKAEFLASMYSTAEGWRGIPAAAFRNAAISACKIVGFHMTKAKLSLFIVPDGFDAGDGTPLVKIEGEPEHYEASVRNATGVIDLRVRAMWREWRMALNIKYDADQFSETDIANLLMRVGEQVGVGEGRPDSKSSCGMGFGLFRME